MSDVITLANQIAAEKENIRLAIEGRNVSIPVDTPLSEYAGKIALIASEVSTGDVYYRDPEYDDSATSFTVPVKYSLMDSGALAGKVNLQSINLNNIIYVGDSAFAGDVSLTQFIGNNVKVLGAGALSDCNLTSFSSSSIETVGNGAFIGCPLVSLSLSNTIKLGTNVNSNNSALTTINLPEVVSIGSGAFANCSNLTNISLPKVEYLGSYCFNSIGLDEWNNNNTTFNINLPELKILGDSAFYNCKGLHSLSMPKVERICAKALNYSGSDSGRITQLNVPMCSYIGENAYRYTSTSGSSYDAVRLNSLIIADGCEIHNGGAGEYIPQNVQGKIGSLVCVDGDGDIWGQGTGNNPTSPSTIDFSGLTTITIGYGYNVMNGYMYISDGALDFQNLISISALSGNAFFLYGSPGYNNISKVWLNKNLVISGSGGFFGSIDQAITHIYTDAISHQASWPALSNANWHFNCSHEDFENGIYN